jgi:hypothetical protein
LTGRPKRSASSRYFKRVHRDRERIAAEERKARGEPNEQERWADELVERLRGKGK